MKLSIITINRNNAEGLRKTMESVLSQTYQNIEYIIIDGASTDESVEIIRATALQAEGLDMKWVSEKDKGIYDAMNKGVKKATGDYVWILNSGDCAASSNTVEQMMRILSDSEIDILLGNKIQVYPGRKVESRRRKVECVKPQPMDVSMLTFYSGTVPQDAAFVRRDLFAQYGYFDDKLKICADWKLYLNMIALGGVQPMYVNIDVVLFDMTGISNENHELRLAERRAYLEEVIPASVLKDYDNYEFPIHEYRRLKKHHMWGLVYFIERVLFKLEKWGVLK